MLLLGDVMFDEDTLIEILNEPFERVMFVGSDIYYCSWKNINGKKIGYNPTVESMHIILTKKGNTERILWCINKLGDVGMGNLYRKGGNIWNEDKLFIPKGYIKDADTFSEWREVKKHFA